MTGDPDTAATAAFDAIHRGWGFVNPYMSRDIADAVVAAVRPVIEAEAREAERQRIREGSYDPRHWTVTGEGWRLVPPGLLDGAS